MQNSKPYCLRTFRPAHTVATDGAAQPLGLQIMLIQKVKLRKKPKEKKISMMKMEKKKVQELHFLGIFCLTFTYK